MRAVVVSKELELHDRRHGAAMTFRIDFQAENNEIVNILTDGTVKISLKVLRYAEKSNLVLISFLLQILGISAEKIKIIAGHSEREKLVSSMAMDPVSVQELIITGVS
jgi:uncharacterized protein YggU (UPF0235/DUF167 family)